MEFAGGPGPGIGEDLAIFHHLQTVQMGMRQDNDIKPSGKELPGGGKVPMGIHQDTIGPIYFFVFSYMKIPFNFKEKMKKIRRNNQ